ncbi:hypothetical protein F0L74_21945 [Chitinophaga agrisoli]|uniref:DUF6443 domain-containing protein n=1 Tax=Chitinophaga agrisoli TaxID=2607653 RepID=A0A5B2VL25_9BACT|nr:DUF6443 domain-containing protein [Chitinophaga agrisoli]KAA2238879.1 hypothetical protein F0L74_21945 [Chitinophaga agrisoli]
MRNIYRTLLIGSLVFLLQLITTARLFAQCEVYPAAAYVGLTTGFDIYSVGSYTNAFWSVVSGNGVLVDQRPDGRYTGVKWTSAGYSSEVRVTYTQNGVQVLKCWTVHVYPAVAGGSIAVTTQYKQNEYFPYSTVVNTVTPTGGSGTYQYQWEESFDGTNWSEVAGATTINGGGSNFLKGKIYLRRKAIDANGPLFAYSNVITMGDVAGLQSGRISPSQIITSNTSPSQLLSVTAASGGTGAYSYQWESSADEISWSAISGATAAAYQPGTVSKTTYYRRKVTSGTETGASNTLQVLTKNEVLNKPAVSTITATAPKFTIPAYGSITSDDLNTVSSTVICKPGITDPAQIANLTPVQDFEKSTTYLDGLGRPVQRIQYKANISGKDIAAVGTYDQFGRKTLSYLPYIAPTDANNAGKLRTDAATQQPLFFNTLTGGQEDYYYAVDELEPSPISRTAKTAIPGRSYAGNGAGQRQTIRMNYDYDNVRIWSIGDNVTDMPASSGVYQTGTLKVNVTSDAQGARIYEFSDKDGRVVMKSAQLNADREGDGLRTYFVYDVIGNLRYVLPPLAIKYCTTSNVWNFAASTAASNVLKELGSKYVYDEKGRIIIAETPGQAGPVYMVYDVRDRLVFTQDPVLRGRGLGEWMLCLYDGQDRRIMAALYKNVSATRESLQALMNTEQPSASISYTNPPPIDLFVDENTPASTTYQATNSVSFLPGFDSGTNGTFDAQVNPSATGTVETIIANNPLPSITGFEPLVISYYDNYDWPGAKKFNTAFNVNAGSNLYPMPVTPASNPTGQVTGVKVKVVGKDQWLSQTVFYDDQGRAIQAQSENISGGTDIMTTQYNFSGKVLSSYLMHKNPRSTANPETPVQLRYEYTASGWLSKVYHTLYNGSTPQTKVVSEFTYDEAGRIKTRKLGALETLNYDYDLQGQLKGINSEYARDKNTSHYFGMELFYDNGFAMPRLDGNTSGVTWRRKGNPDEYHAYGYDFDNIGRLTKADYTQNSGSAWTNDLVDYKVSIPSYDENGNIKQMKQDGMLLGNVKSGIDDMTYNYENGEWSNRLDGVTDLQGNKQQGDFKNYSGRTGTDDYSYDVNGNLIKDKNKGITVTYSYLLDKPEKISIDSDPNKNITFVYDATGKKLQKIVKDGTNTITYTYINGFVYKDDVLMLFPQPEGRVRRNSNGALVYDYFISDHLGNTRTVITEESNIVYYKATHEDNPQPQPIAPEREMFTFPKNVDPIPVGNKFYDYNGTTNRKFIRLNGNDADRKIGTAKVLKVMAGDQVEMGVMSYYPVNAASNNTPDQPADLIVGQLINLLLGPASVIPNGKNNILQSNSNGLILNKEDFNTYVDNTQDGNPPSTVPKAYLNYVLFDDNFKMVNGGVVRVSQPDAVAPLAASMNINKNGYLYVYVSNESPTDVYFDDLVVKHTTGHLLQEDSYYPFGLQIRGLSSMALNRLQNDYLYNGIEKIGDFDLEVYDAMYRNLDPQTGRWWQVDPAAGKYAGISPYNSNFNNPVGFTDPLGNDPGDGGNWFTRFFKRLFGGNTEEEIAFTYTSKPYEYVGQRLPGEVVNSGGELLNLHFVTQGFLDLDKNDLSRELAKINPQKSPTSQSGRDNLRPPDLKPLETQAPPPLTDISADIQKTPTISAQDPCVGCQDMYRWRYLEKERIRKTFETAEGQSFLVVKSTLEAASWEFATYKVLQGATYLGVTFMGRLGAEASFDATEFATEVISFNKTTEGAGRFYNGDLSTAIHTAMYYETPAEQGAAIFRSISHGHMFENGNKRTAVFAFKLFAKQHGLSTIGELDMLNVATQVAEGNITDVSQIASILVK